MEQNLKTETRQVSGFDRLVLTDFGELIVQQGDVESLTIEAAPELLERIRSDVENGTLTVGIRSWLDRIFAPFEHRVRYTLLVKNLAAMKISGSVKAQAASLSAKNFVIEISGSSSIRIDELTAEKLTLTTSGSSDFQLAGRVQSQEVRISGASKIQAVELESETARVNISGSGHTVLWVTDKLDVRISGAGTVEYKGSPQVNQSISGVGSIRQITA